MRCPKCHYLSFEPEPRCRNCGHALDLSGPLDVAIPGLITDEPAAAADVADAPAPTPARIPAPAPARPARAADQGGPPPSLLRERPRLAPDTPTPAGPFDDTRAEAARAVTEAENAPAVPEPVAPLRREATRPTPRVTPPTTELPLFVRGLSDTAGIAPELDAPLVKVPSTPRAPLAVRMRTPEPAPAPPSEVRGTDEMDPFDRDLLDDLKRLERFEPRDDAAGIRESTDRADEHDQTAASARALAASIDAAVLVSIMIVVLWMTLRWCDLSLGQITMLPVAPMATFFAMMVLGYWLLFTAAGGQTLGKMAAHLRVVDATAEEPEMVTIGQAFRRSCASVLTVATLGLGWLPGLFGDGRALHDRLAGTRVIRS